MVKVCSKCKVEKPFDEFYKDKALKNGLRSNCKSCVDTQSKDYYESNKDKIISKTKTYYESNKDKIKTKKKAYREANKDKIKAKRKIYYQANKDKIKAKTKAYKRERKKTDSLYKMKCNLRNRTYKAFINKGYSKNTKTQEILGVDWMVVKKHIEIQFTKGMNWDNQGEWHIDHIIPLASAKTPERLKQLCHYTNLQPLWAKDNLSKSDKIENQQTLLRI